MTGKSAAKTSPPKANGRALEKARSVLDSHLAKKGLNHSSQRDAVLETFFKSGRHLSVDELFALVHQKHPDVGRTTVYRSLKLFVDAGLASELALDGHSRYEIELGRSHHDHFICNSCGSIFEFMSPSIERLQEVEAGKIGFRIEGHRHQILGLCRDCAPATRA